MSLLKVMEHTSANYGPRTFHNAHLSDVTLAFAADFGTAGEKLTAKAAGDKLFGFDIERHNVHARVNLCIAFCAERKPQRGLIVNVAGNGLHTLSRRMKNPETMLDQYVYFVLHELAREMEIRLVMSGGQTGADTSGARAGLMLERPVHAMFPVGYKIRTADGADRVQTAEQAARRIILGANIIPQAKRNRLMNEWMESVCPQPTT